MPPSICRLLVRPSTTDAVVDRTTVNIITLLNPATPSELTKDSKGHNSILHVRVFSRNPRAGTVSPSLPTSGPMMRNANDFLQLYGEIVKYQKLHAICNKISQPCKAPAPQVRILLEVFGQNGSP